MREECICNICNAAANLNISQSNEEQEDSGDRQISFASDELVPDRPKSTKPKGNMESGWMDGYARWSKLDDVLEQPPAATNDDKETEGKEKTQSTSKVDNNADVASLSENDIHHCNAAANRIISMAQADSKEEEELGDERISFALEELVPERTNSNTGPKGNMESGWMDGY